MVERVEYPDYRFILQHLSTDHMYLQVEFFATCAVTGERELQRGRKWLISKHMVPSEIVTTCLKAVLAAVEHEVRENFTYRSEAIFHPHFNVDELHSLARNPETSDVRVPV